MKLLTIFSMKTIRELSFIKWMKKIASSSPVTDFLIKSVASIIILTFAFIPTYFYIGVRYLIEPVGFWQEFAILVMACITIGWLQVLMAIGAVALIISIIIEEI